jgi:hydrogenase expression/formation protein HypE
MDQLISRMFVPAFKNDLLETRHDGAVFDVPKGRLAFSTDGYVVQPLFFPGGDIGSLAVNGTVNDLAMCGARPLYLSAGFILEEGLPMETLWRVVQSMKACAEAAGVRVVTGDTKVVDKGKGDGIFITTAGVGVVEHDLRIAPSAVAFGDAVLVSGDIGRHGAAIMAQRESLAFDSEIRSDCAPLNGVVAALLDEGLAIHCMRDLTRGGLASALIELAAGSGTHIHVERAAVPLREDVRGACEILGLDPFYMANEGRMTVVVPDDQAEAALACMRQFEPCRDCCRIGHVSDEKPGRVTVKSEIGATRLLDMLSGEQLPRIC